MYKQLTEATQTRRLLSRGEAATYLIKTFGFGSTSTLAKLAMGGKSGPIFKKWGRQRCYYAVEDLDRWALSALSGPTTQSEKRRPTRVSPGADLAAE
jgi:hypothetical protein